ncbi:unnamed protein product [Prorocentrum cordatum]|uniref:Uncharacterized protein n=1 Tax=Prorocentrum cordatum TaxID=2364126 RepID=A0ABN9SF08_9DINO|nr:unnamed protein product [Polarella glacialis]
MIKILPKSHVPIALQADTGLVQIEAHDLSLAFVFFWCLLYISIFGEFDENRCLVTFWNKGTEQQKHLLRRANHILFVLCTPSVVVFWLAVLIRSMPDFFGKIFMPEDRGGGPGRVQRRVRPVLRCHQGESEAALGLLQAACREHAHLLSTLGGPLLAEAAGAHGPAARPSAAAQRRSGAAAQRRSGAARSALRSPPSARPPRGGGSSGAPSPGARAESKQWQSVLACL